MYTQQVRLHGQIELPFKYRNSGTFTIKEYSAWQLLKDYKSSYKKNKICLTIVELKK